MVVGSPIVLNLIPGGVMPVIMINETDKGYQKEFLIYNGNAPYNVPANVSATIRGTKRDGLGVTEAATVTAGSNVVRITVTEQMTAVPGTNIFELVFVDTNGLRVATINFIMLVERSALNANTVISDSDIAYSEQVLNQLQSVAAYAEALDNKPYKFDTVAQMQADTALKAGMYAQTGGYYTVNDGGGALYRIYSTVPSTYYETLSNGLYAELIYEDGAVTSEQLGTLTASKLNGILSNASIKEVHLSGTVTIDTPLVINTPKRIISHDFTVHQTAWGYPAVDVESDDVSIIGVINLVMDVTTRSAITNSTPHYHPGSTDPKADSTGVMLGWQNTLKNFKADRVNVYNFIGGITNTALRFDNIQVGYLYVENVDFGLFGSRFYNAVFDTIEFKDIASYVGSDDPSHVVYLTGGTVAGTAQNVTIMQIYGDGCKSKASDTVLSIKSCENFQLYGGVLSNICGLASVILATGFIKNIYADIATNGFSVQVSGSEFTFEDIKMTNVSLSGMYLNFFTTGSISHVRRCSFGILTDDAAYPFVYTSSEYHEENCEYIAPDAKCYVYKRTGTSKFFIKRPKINTKIYDPSGNMTDNAAFEVDPALLNFPVTNGLIPNPLFLPNSVVVDEQSATLNHPVGFRTNDHVKVTGGTIYDFNTNNATNGQVYTLYNGLDGNGNGTTKIDIGNGRIITKSGGNYAESEWMIFRFMNIGNKAIEI